MVASYREPAASATHRGQTDGYYLPFWLAKSHAACNSADQRVNAVDLVHFVHFVHLVHYSPTCFVSCISDMMVSNEAPSHHRHRQLSASFLA